MSLFATLFLLISSLFFGHSDLPKEIISKPVVAKENIKLSRLEAEKQAEIKKNLAKNIQPILQKIAPVVSIKNPEPVSIDFEQKDDFEARKIVALTFDDGPAPTTDKVLEILKNHHIKGTFFTVGQQIKNHSGKLKAIQKAGQTIASHSYSHKNFLNMTPAQIQSDFDQMDALIESRIGEKPKFFRSPYGLVNDFILQHSKMPIIQWSVDIKDWEGEKSQQFINETLDAQLQTGGIILLHDLKKSSPKNLLKILNYLERNNFKVVPLQTILDEYQRHFDAYPYILGQAYRKYILPKIRRKTPKKIAKPVVPVVPPKPKKADLKDVLKYYKNRSPRR